MSSPFGSIIVFIAAYAVICRRHQPSAFRRRRQSTAAVPEIAASSKPPTAGASPVFGGCSAGCVVTGAAASVSRVVGEVVSGFPDGFVADVSVEVVSVADASVVSDDSVEEAEGAEEMGSKVSSALSIYMV